MDTSKYHEIKHLPLRSAFMFYKSISFDTDHFNANEDFKWLEQKLYTTPDDTTGEYCMIALTHI